MSIKSSLITYLNTKAALTGLVGDRIRFIHAEQDDALPYVVLFQVSGQQSHHMLAATGKATARFQFDCFGDTPTSAMNVAEQLRLALDGFRGSMGDVFLSTCHLESERDNTTQPIEGDHTGVESVQQDYMITWTVSVPSFA